MRLVRLVRLGGNLYHGLGGNLYHALLVLNIRLAQGDSLYHSMFLFSKFSALCFGARNAFQGIHFPLSLRLVRLGGRLVPLDGNLYHPVPVFFCFVFWRT